jgi:hypothetical protein
MGGIVGLELAAQKVGGEGGRLAHGLAGCIKDVPFAFNGLLGKHGCGHIFASNIKSIVLTVSGAGK